MIFFAEKEHLTKPGRGIFLSDKITDHGKYMDNQETWRRCISGNDCVILRLALRVEIRKLEVDTIFFKGNLSESLFNRISKFSRWFLTKKLGNTRRRVANFTSGAKTQSRSKTFFLIGIKILWSSHPPAPQYFSGWRIESFSCFGRKCELSNNFLQ